MEPSNLSAWVKQQYKEIGFGPNRDGPFIGRSALKKKLISRYPKRKTEIRQLVNALQVQDRLQPKAMPAKIKTNQASLIRESKLRDISSHRSDSGMATSPEGLENNANSNCLWKDSSTNSPFTFLGIEEDGGAILASNPTTVFAFGNGTGSFEIPRNIFEFGKPAERSSTFGNFETKPSTFLPSGTMSEAMDTTMTVEQATFNPKILQLKKFLDEGKEADLSSQGVFRDELSTLELQLGLLHLSLPAQESGEEPSVNAVQNSVLFSVDMLQGIGKDHLPQYGLLGSSDSASSSAEVSDSRLFLNTNIPFSAFVCGVQGSGKSHTTACMIENCLIPSPVLGVLQKPLSALVFNFAEYASAASFRPCELAFLASPSSQFPNRLGARKVNVLVSPSNYSSLKKLYTQIPNVAVQPFKLRPEDLNISTMLTLMSVDQTQTTPLYMGMVTKILRGMAAESAESFNYLQFRRKLDDAGLDRKQIEFLDQRLDLLESFLDLDGSTTKPVFAAGEITIIDLSCPFVDASTACVMFKVGMGLYLESDPEIGKVIVLDEAHKYMTDTPASKALTDSLMGVIRQQRHYGARIIISTQEPGISPKLIDLCSITIMHRFSSPEWLGILKRHILLSDDNGDKGKEVGLLRDIMRLKTGEAMVFVPSAILGARNEDGQRRNGSDALLKMRMRKRVTWDGGRSIVCI